MKRTTEDALVSRSLTKDDVVLAVEIAQRDVRRSDAIRRVATKYALSSEQVQECLK